VHPRIQQCRPIAVIGEQQVRHPIDDLAPGLAAVSPVGQVRQTLNDCSRRQELLHERPERIVAVQGGALEEMTNRAVLGDGSGQLLASTTK
jgi:hypothetical protein